jgi:hypothetical protein
VALDFLQQFSLLGDDGFERFFEIGLGGGIAAGGVDGDGDVDLSVLSIVS